MQVNRSNIFTRRKIANTCTLLLCSFPLACKCVYTIAVLINGQELPAKQGGGRELSECGLEQQ